MPCGHGLDLGRTQAVLRGSRGANCRSAVAERLTRALLRSHVAGRASQVAIRSGHRTAV
jgi:hypothetical protein